MSFVHRLMHYRPPARMVGELPGFRVFDGSRRNDHRLWLRLWQEWPCKDIHMHPDYVDLYAGPGMRPYLAVTLGEGWSIALPLVLRDIPIPHLGRVSLPGVVDISSPYGFGGPFTSGPVETSALDAFWRELTAWASGVPVVSEFIRFGPNEHSQIGYPGEIVESGVNVVRDLTLDAESLWMDVEHKVRKNVKKAQRSGVTVDVATSAGELDAFLSIYMSTMDRRAADSAYLFSEEFFHQLCSKLAGSYALFHARYLGRVVSTELVLVSDESVYSFLGGTSAAAYSVRPNDLLKYHIIDWAQSLGKKRYILGGGYRPGDGILRYKLSFAPDGGIPYVVGRRILDAQAYSEAVEARRSSELRQSGKVWNPRPGYFPSYRG